MQIAVIEILLFNLQWPQLNPDNVTIAMRAI